MWISLKGKSKHCYCNQTESRIIAIEWGHFKCFKSKRKMLKYDFYRGWNFPSNVVFRDLATHFKVTLFKWQFWQVMALKQTQTSLMQSDRKSRIWYRKRQCECRTMRPWPKFWRSNISNLNISETMSKREIARYDFYRGWYSSPIGITRNVVPGDLDLNFQGQAFEQLGLISRKR